MAMSDMNISILGAHRVSTAMPYFTEKIMLLTSLFVCAYSAHTDRTTIKLKDQTIQALKVWYLLLILNTWMPTESP